MTTNVPSIRASVMICG